MNNETLKDVVKQGSKCLNPEIDESRRISTGYGLKALPPASDSSEEVDSWSISYSEMTPEMWDIFNKFAVLVNYGDDVCYRLPALVAKRIATMQKVARATKAQPAPTVNSSDCVFQNPYIRKGMLTPNPEWERKVWSGEVDRQYGVKSKELVATLPAVLANSSFAFARPSYFIDLYCLRVAMALRLRFLHSRDRVLNEFSHASIYRDEWQDSNCHSEFDCDRCPNRDDCADIFWGEC